MKSIKSLIKIAVLTLGMSFSMCMPVLADDLPGAGSPIAIGDKNKATTVIRIRNKTGLRILSLRVINTETTEASENFIRKGFEVNGTADMYYDFDDDVTYTLQLTIKGKYYYLHHFPFDDASSIRIYKAKNYVYIKYTSVSTGETVSTRLKEKKHKGKDKYSLGKRKVDTSDDKTKIYTTEDSATKSKPVVVSPDTETDSSDTTDSPIYYDSGGSNNTYDYGGSGSSTTTDDSGSSYGSSDSGSTTNGSTDSGSQTPGIIETPTDSTTMNSGFGD